MSPDGSGDIIAALTEKIRSTLERAARLSRQLAEDYSGRFYSADAAAQQRRRDAIVSKERELVLMQRQITQWRDAIGLLLQDQEAAIEIVTNLTKQVGKHAIHSSFELEPPSLLHDRGWARVRDTLSLSEQTEVNI